MPTLSRCARRVVPVLFAIGVVVGTRTQAAPGDVVLYASDVTAIRGAWSRVSDNSAAAGQMMTSATSASSNTSAAMAAPTDYFESAFSAPAGTPYHVWVRLRAAGDSKWSDSLWLQFSDATLAAGAAIDRTGSTNALLVNLATDGTGSSDVGWGWQDGAYWLAQPSTLQFATSGTHTVRVQIREAGVQVDQIVLSPSTFLNAAPGPVSGDATIVPKPASSQTSTPLSGTPAPIPGVILAENYDVGGEGVAYYDTTAGNSGGAYRQDDVDLTASTDGNNCVGWTVAGEWLHYTVNVASAGTYTATFRVASLGAGGSFHLTANGGTASGSVAIPDTGGWQNWVSVTANVTLGAGVQVIGLVWDANGVSGAAGNVTSMAFAAAPGAGSTSSTGLSPYTGVPASVPGTIQAVNFDNGGEGVAYHDTTPGNAGSAYRQTDVDIQSASDGGYNVGWTAPGEWLNYTVNVAAAGTYTVQLRVASAGGAALHVGFNGPSAGVWPSVAVPGTGGWQSWTTVAVPVSLGAGVQQLTVMFDTGAVNLESIVVTAAGSGVAAPAIPHFSHAYVIVLENHELSDIIGNPAAPYLNQLAAQYGLATAYTAVTHPSLPNYMSLTGGDTYFSDDCVGCTVSAGNIGDELESAGITWKAYMESMPGACGTSDTTLYATKHDPFIHYDDIVSNAARCQAHVVPWSTWTADAAAGTIPRFVWITPNLCSDMHDCDVATGDTWLSGVVPQILRTPDFGNSVLFIVWDEGTSSIGGGGLVPLLVVSPLVTPGFTSSIPATHFDLLRTLEDAWGLQPLARTAGARSLGEFFPH